MAEEAKNKASASKFRTSIGGQALIEGVLMRGPGKQAIVVRSPDGLVEKVEELTLVRDKYPVLGLPIIRGAVTFVDSMVKGVKALMFSADYFPDEDVAEPSKFDQWLEKKLGNEKMQKFITALAVFLSLGLTILFFFLLPTFLAGFIDPYIKSAAVHNLVESVIKLVIFFAYMILCSKQKDIYRVFQYHGAEHKTIFCYEAGLPLTVENVRIQPRHHPRCGTSFLFVVIFVSILVSSVVFGIWPITNVWLRTLAHLILLPLVVVVAMLPIDWRMGLAALVTIPLGTLFFAAMMRGYGPRMENYMRSANEMNSAAFKGFWTLGGVAHHKDRFTKAWGFFLNAA